MAYVHAFSRIPQSGDKTTGLLRVSKADGRWQHRVVMVSDIVWLCPLAPIIRGPAARDVNRDNVLERYSDFYLNKYRNIDDYIFMSSYSL